MKTFFLCSLGMILFIGLVPGTMFAQYNLYVSGGGKLYINGFMPDTVTPTLQAAQTHISGGSEINNKGRFAGWRITTLGTTSRFTSTGEEYLTVTNMVASGIGSSLITGNGVFNFGNIFQRCGGIIYVSTSITCISITWVTKFPIFLNSANVSITVEGGEDAIKNFGLPNNMIVLRDPNTKLIRKMWNPGETYPFPIAYSGTPPPPFFQDPWFYNRIDVKPVSFGFSGPGYISAVSKTTITGVVSYQKNFLTGFSNVNGVCYPGPHSQDVKLTCRGDKGWTVTGPPDWLVALIGYPATPCGSLFRRLIRSPAGTNAWQANIEDVDGSLENSFCSYSSWTMSSAVMGGLYKGFGDFVAAGGSATGLPVELVSFDAKPIDNEYIRLDWQTALEIDNDKFVVTRSTDGYVFDLIGEVAGNGTTTTVHDYSYNDRNVIPNVVYYYRLTQFDYDGDTANSGIVSAYLTGDGEGTISVYPNPTTGTAIVHYTGTADISASVYSAIGSHVVDIPHVREQMIDLREFANGVYIIDFNSNNFHQQVKIIKTGN